MCVFWDKKILQVIPNNSFVEDHGSASVSLSLPPSLSFSSSVSLGDPVLCYGFHTLTTFTSRSAPQSLLLSPDHCIQVHAWAAQRHLIKLVLNTNHGLFLQICPSSVLFISVSDTVICKIQKTRHSPWLALLHPPYPAKHHVLANLSPKYAIVGKQPFFYCKKRQFQMIWPNTYRLCSLFSISVTSWPTWFFRWLKFLSYWPLGICSPSFLPLFTLSPEWLFFNADLITSYFHLKFSISSQCTWNRLKILEWLRWCYIFWSLFPLPFILSHFFPSNSSCDHISGTSSGAFGFRDLAQDGLLPGMLFTIVLLGELLQILHISV